MKFVHEFVDYPNLKDVDNSWWEYDDVLQRCYNPMGGWHNYHPHPKDTIVEGTWDDVITADLKLNKDSYITGWISPEGDFFGCSPQNHSIVAEYIYGCSELELEQKGFIKVYELPALIREEYSYRYDFFGRPTLAQQEILMKLGLM